MLNPIQSMYRDVILDHYEHPRNCHDLAHVDAEQEGYNPLCGDHVDIKIEAHDNTLTDVSVCTKGCAICTASGSIMSGILKGKTLPEVDQLIQDVKAHLTGESNMDMSSQPSVLKVLEGVRKFPVRIKCALLPWTTLEIILRERKGQD